MKILFQREDFFNILHALSGVVSQNPTMPILSNFLLKALEDELVLEATDLNMSLSIRMPAEVIICGEIVLPVKMIQEIIRELPEDKINLEVKEGDKVEITCQKAIFHLTGLSKDDFPVFPSLEEEVSITLPTLILKDMIKKTIFCAATDEMRTILNGADLKILNNKIIMVATDGNRLAFIEKEIEGTGVEKEVVIPTKTLNELVKIINEDKIDLKIGKNRVSFSTTSSILSSRLLEGDFPDYSKVIPKGETKDIKVETIEFINSVRRVATMTLEKSNTLKFTVKPDKLKIEVATPTVGEAEEEINVSYQDEEMEMGFNYKYLLEVLRRIKTEETLIFLTSPNIPALFKPTEENPDYFFLLGPTKLADS
ncbi:DNA polymerase III subunit beta [bacterium]|nr:DNA polymerase III subunit beta [bacterium]MBU1614006.1 DNA polymerase III subunit beta [bacterium]